MKVKPMKVTEKESEKWDKAAELAKEDGRTSFNHWARKVLNRAADRMLKKHGDSGE